MMNTDRQLPLQLGDRIGQKATESATKARRTEGESKALLDLITLVPPN